MESVETSPSSNCKSSTYIAEVQTSAFYRFSKLFRAVTFTIFLSLFFFVLNRTGWLYSLYAGLT